MSSVGRGCAVFVFLSLRFGIYDLQNHVEATFLFFVVDATVTVAYYTTILHHTNQQ